MRGLTSRLLIFNLLLAVFPIGAVFFLGTYEIQLLDSQERAMVQQGRILASALEGHNLEEKATMILGRLRSRTDSRLRVVDTLGRLVADSAAAVTVVEAEIETGKFSSIQDIRSPSPADSEDAELPASEEDSSYPEENVIYRIGALPVRTFRRITGFIRPPEAPAADSEYYSGKGGILDGQEIQAALDGRYGAATRISQGQRSVTLYSAIPVFTDDEVIGAVLVSRSTFAILNDLYQLRLDITIIFLFSIGGAVVLSLLLARTVTVPVGRLRDQAESILDERGKLMDRFKPLSGKDEVADLSRALHHLSTRLQERTDHMEDFMADLVHELKNPVAGILSASELAERTAEIETRRFLGVIDREGHRISRLLDDLKELISVDVRLDKGPRKPIEVSEILEGLVTAYPYHRKGGAELSYINSSDVLLRTEADPDRLAQAVLNLVDNAISFTESGSKVVVRLIRYGEEFFSIEVLDQGPGLPDAEKIFERWYTDRPAEEAADHTGLGLAIVRGIAEGYGGAVEAETREEGGSVFRILLPIY